MKLRKTLSVLLALLLAASLAAPAFAADGGIRDEILTRGMFVSALYTLSEVKTPAPSLVEFADVPAYCDLAKPVSWAVDKGIVNGYGNGLFGPDDPVTREQMAAMLYRYAQTLGQGFQGLWMFPLDYPDAFEVSDYADEAMHWVVMKGILVGTDKGLEPKALATKAQLALVLQRWQKTLLAAPEEDELWFSFDCLGIALKAPADMEFRVSEYDNYFAKNDKVQIHIRKLEHVGDPCIEALAAFTAAAAQESVEIINRGGVDMVRVNAPTDAHIYTVVSPDNDYYALGIAPCADEDTGLVSDDAAMAMKLVELSLRRSGNILESGNTIRVFGAEHPAIDYLVLVNGQNALPENWRARVDLVLTENSVGDTVEVERSAYKAYMALKAEVAQKDGIELELDSVCAGAADPDCSERQTGLALDLYFIINGTTYYENEAKLLRPDVWNKIHAKLADHGFILRYPEGKEQITGFAYEPWHIRYVGVEAAQRIADRRITLEEWLGAA